MLFIKLFNSLIDHPLLDKYVEVVVYTTSGIVVASANHVPLNGTYTKMSLSVQFTKKIPAGTYVGKVDTSDTKDYDVSTYFYY